MNGQRGKITFMNLVVFLILVLGGFMAFKYIATGIEKKQIKKEVFDSLGGMRGGETDSAELTAVVERILEKKKIEIIEVYAELDKNKGMIYFYYKYKIDTNYLLFRNSEIIEVEDEMASYGI
ncbi:MAG: hypothetical protein ABII93_06580 [Chrysiogenia bacterium]